jgi:hypothetical protein
MRKPLLILLAVELLVAVVAGQIAQIDRPAMARACVEWRQNPTDATRQALEHQLRITEMQRWAFSAVVFGAFAGATGLVFWNRRGAPAASPHGDPTDPPADSGAGGGPPSVS